MLILFIISVLYKISLQEFENIKEVFFSKTTYSLKPILPCKEVWVILPYKSEIIDYKVYANYLPIKEKYNVEINKIKVNECEVIKLKNESLSVYPESSYKFLCQTYFNNYNIAKFIIYPFKYDFESNNLFYSQDFSIDINYTPFIDKFFVDTSYDYILKDFAINFNERFKWYIPKEKEYDYVIFTQEELNPYLAEFIFWKSSLGYKVLIENDVEKIRSYLPKYVLTIGEGNLIDGYITGNIPYSEPSIIKNILEKTIEFELNNYEKNILFVKGISNFANECSSTVNLEDKESLISKIKEISKLPYTITEEKVISGNYSFINFLSCDKTWLFDNGNNVPDSNEIYLSKYFISINKPYIIFSPFNCKEFLSDAIALICPFDKSKYVIDWSDTLDGGNQTFNYIFLRNIFENKSIGDALFLTKIFIEKNLPEEDIDFIIYGDPSLSLQKMEYHNVKIINHNITSILPDTFLRPMCVVTNFCNRVINNINIFCEIIDKEKVIYKECISIDSILPNQIDTIEFAEWTNYELGKKYNVNFYTPSDTIEKMTFIGRGACLVFGDSLIYTTLNNLGYISAYTYEIPKYCNFNSIFILDTIPKIDSYLVYLPKNMYIEDNNIWVKRLFKCEEISGVFLPYNSEIIKDSLGEIISFRYSNDYKIYWNKIKLNALSDSERIKEIKSIMNFFGIEENIEKLKEDVLISASPNPFYGKTNIKFKLNYRKNVNLSIYNVSGNLVNNIFSGELLPGEYEYYWDGKDKDGKSVVPGVYFLVISSEKSKKFVKLLFLK